MDMNPLHGANMHWTMTFSYWYDDVLERDG